MSNRPTAYRAELARLEALFVEQDLVIESLTTALRLVLTDPLIGAEARRILDEADLPISFESH